MIEFFLFFLLQVVLFVIFYGCSMIFHLLNGSTESVAKKAKPGPGARDEGGEESPGGVRSRMGGWGGGAIELPWRLKIQ